MREHSCGRRSAQGPVLGMTSDEPQADQLESRFRVAKPRLLARVVVDELEGARQAGHEYQPPTDVGKVVERTAQRLVKDAER